MKSPSPQLKEDFMTLVRLVGEHFDITSDALLSTTNRTHQTVYARKCIAYFAMQLFPSLTLSDLGKMLNSDHSGIHYSLRTLKKRILTDKRVKGDVDAIQSLINGVWLPVSEELIEKDRSDHLLAIANQVWEELHLMGCVTKEDFSSYLNYAFKKNPHKRNLH